MDISVITGQHGNCRMHVCTGCHEIIKGAGKASQNSSQAEGPQGGGAAGKDGRLQKGLAVMDRRRGAQKDLVQEHNVVRSCVSKRSFW